MRKRVIFIGLLCFLFVIINIGAATAQEAAVSTASAPVAAEEDKTGGETAGPRLALGFTLDLLPTVLSAVAGDFGMSGQTWLGIEHLRLRLVGAHMHMPQFLIGGKGFEDASNTVGAVIVDYVFGQHFDGWWVGTGFELWMNEIGNKDAPDAKERWNNLVWTAGGGYIWRAAGNFYIEPWAALHVPMNNRNIEMAGHEYKPMPVSGEVSLKIGYFFDL